MKKTSKKQSKTQESTNLVVGDIVLYQDDIIDKTEKFKIVEILDDKLHIKLITEPYSSYLVPIKSVSKV